MKIMNVRVIVLLTLLVSSTILNYIVDGTNAVSPEEFSRNLVHVVLFTHFAINHDIYKTIFL